jgi:tRNA threonylcarbamoyladenosine biosynthesis protein TsaE
VIVTLVDASATRAFGRRLASILRAGDVVLLVGQLGAGKTTLAQGIGEGLGVEGSVASPTFIIARVHPARPAGLPLVHVDAYRLPSLAELDDLDLDTSLEESVTVVEWGSGIAEVLAASYLTVTLDRGRGGEAQADSSPRDATIDATGPRWAGVDLTVLERGLTDGFEP